MKNTNICPKCNSNSIAKIKSDSLGVRIGTGAFSIALTNHYICCTCGYTETWVESKEDLEKLKKKLI